MFLGLQPFMAFPSCYGRPSQAGWHKSQVKAADALNGRARQQQQQQQQHITAPVEAVRMVAPGVARLTADADGLVVHHCLANRRDLHAEYPPGAAPAPTDAAPGSQGNAAGRSEGDPPRQLSAAEDDNAAASGIVPGLLRFPWESGPLLEALLHNHTGSTSGQEALPPVSVKDLPAPEPGCGVRTEDVIDALVSEGVLVVA